MSNLSAQIRSAFDSTIESTVTGIAKMKWINDVAKNEFRGKDNKYGVRSLDATAPDESIIRTLTLDHDYEVILTQGYKNIAPNDLNQMASVDTLHDRMDDIAKAVENTKLGLPSIVLLTTLAGIGEPEILEDEKVTILRATFTIKYRSNL